VIKWNKKYAFKDILRNDLAPALFRAILDVFPVLGPLLTPLESPTTAHTDLGLKTVFSLWGRAHDSSLIRPMSPLQESQKFAK
jgi:hypothetical protein